MATCARTIVKVLAGCQRHLRTPRNHSVTSLSKTESWHLPIRTFAAVKAVKKEQKDTKPKVENEKKVDDANRHKPYGLTAWEPVDDVYMPRYYPKPVYDIGVAVDMLKTFQRLDYSSPKQSVFMDLKLDMKLEKKKKVDPFVSTVQLPYPLKTEANRVLVFTENPQQAKVALESGAAYVGGVELVQKVLDDEIQADFYVAVPEIVAELLPLKNKLRKKFPKSKRGTVGVNIPKMLELFRTGHEYLVERDFYVVSKVATALAHLFVKSGAINVLDRYLKDHNPTHPELYSNISGKVKLDMPKEQILSNIKKIIEDVCSHRPAKFGPFIERAIICSTSSEALRFDSRPFLPKVEEEDAVKGKA